VVHAVALKHWCTDSDLLLALFREAWLIDHEVAALLATDESTWQARATIRVLAVLFKRRRGSLPSSRSSSGSRFRSVSQIGFSFRLLLQRIAGFVPTFVCGFC
jgi:hypothetical protein